MNHQISFKSLIYRGMKKWRVVVVFTMVLAMISGSVSVIKSLNSVAKKDGATNTQVIAYENEKQQLLKQTERIKSDIAETDFLLSNQMEDGLPQGKENISEALLAITPDLTPEMPTDMVNTDAMIQYYILDKNASIQNMYPIKLEEIKYLYFATINDLSLYDDIKIQLGLNISSDQLRKQVSQSYNYNSLLIQVTGFDAKINLAVRDAVLEEVIAFEAILNGNNPIHTLKLLRTSSTIIEGTAWQSLRTGADAKKQELETELTKLEQRASNLMPPAAEANKSAQISIGNLLFYIAVGMICGCAIGVLVVFLQILFSTKIWALEDLENGYELPVLGEFLLHQ